MMKVIVEYEDNARNQLHRLIKKLEADIDALGTVRVYSRYRIVGSDGREILHNSASPGPLLMEPLNKEVKAE